jgi:hypothetical protein
MGTESIAVMPRSPSRTWHCAALRSVGTLLLRAAERLDRAPPRALPLEPLVAHLSGREERLLDLRHRIHCRYY